MTQLLFYLLVFVFVFFYLLRGLHMAGYENIKYRNNSKKRGPVVKSFMKIIFSFKPLLQRKLIPKGVDYKVHARFQKQSSIYYGALWIYMFLLLFLTAKIYLNAF